MMLLVEFMWVSYHFCFQCTNEKIIFFELGCVGGPFTMAESEFEHLSISRTTKMIGDG